MVTEAEARRIRPMMSGIVALAVALVAAIGWYYLGRPDESQQPVPTVSTAEWRHWVDAGRGDGKLQVLAPIELPEGWRAKAVSYVSGSAPAWHLALSTATGRFVGIEESRASVAEIVAQYVDQNARRGTDVAINGETWEVWTDPGGDYALVRELRGPSGEDERVLVVGTAPDAQIRSFAATLEPSAR